MSDHDRGRIDTNAAEVYESLFVPSLFGRFADPIADAAELRPGDSVVDIACGTGALTRAIRARTTGRVVGVDINPAMIVVASRTGDDIEYLEGDVASLMFDDDTFEVAVSQFGLMFFDNPSLAIRQMARVAGRGLVAIWDSIERSEGYLAMQELFRSELGEKAASSLDAPFAMGRDGVLESAFEAADIKNVEYASIEGTGRFQSIGQWVTTEVRGWTLGDSVTDQDLANLIVTAHDHLAPFAADDGIVFGMTAKIAAWKK
ncbi:MAG TPA: methyltransferase domain-containing protein [Acidimicrobiia bacterium]|nr:methyltransferase domain-containing protein [Acidimicrobiia bacterium]